MNIDNISNSYLKDATYCVFGSLIIACLLHRLIQCCTGGQSKAKAATAAQPTITTSIIQRLVSKIETTIAVNIGEFAGFTLSARVPGASEGETVRKDLTIEDIKCMSATKSTMIIYTPFEFDPYDKLQQLIKFVKHLDNQSLSNCIDGININSITRNRLPLIKTLMNHLSHIKTLSIFCLPDEAIEILNPEMLPKLEHLQITIIDCLHQYTPLYIANFSNLKTISIGKKIPPTASMIKFYNFPNLILGDGLDKLQKIEFIPEANCSRDTKIEFNAPLKMLQVLSLRGEFFLPDPDSFFKLDNFKGHFPALKTFICKDFSSDDPEQEPSIKLYYNVPPINLKEIVEFVHRNKELSRLRNLLTTPHSVIPLFLLTHLKDNGWGPGKEKDNQ